MITSFVYHLKPLHLLNNFCHLHLHHCHIVIIGIVVIVVTIVIFK